MTRGIRLVGIGLSLAVAGCGAAAPAKRASAPHDPLEAAALAAPLLTDPDLTAMSRRYELLSFDAPIENSEGSAPSPSSRR